MANIVAQFERAEIDKENGSFILQPGVTYFFDTDEKDVFPTDDFGGIHPNQLVFSIPNNEITSVLRSGRGQVMVALKPSIKTIVPRDITLKTGYFYVLPEDMGLDDAQRKLYGTHYDNPRGLFEFLGDYNPALLQHAINAAEGVKETVEQVTDRSKEIVKIVIASLAGVLGLYVIVKATEKRSK